MNGATQVNGAAKTEDLVFTEVGEIPKILGKSREAFLSLKTKDIEWRKKQLRKLYWALVSPYFCFTRIFIITVSD